MLARVSSANVNEKTKRIIEFAGAVTDLSQKMILEDDQLTDPVII
jgi:hypothetical protein